MMYPAANMYSLPKLEKRAFLTAIFLNYMFYGILISGIHFGFHNSYISASIKIAVLLLSGGLFLYSVANNKYGRFSIWMKAEFAYILYMFFMLIIYTPPAFSTAYGSDMGKIFNYYVFFAYGIAPFAIFLMTRERLLFLVNNEWIVFLPSFISTALILILFRDVLSSDYATVLLSGTGVNRATIAEPLMVLFAMSVFWVIFFNKIWKFAFGCAGLLISLYGIYLSSSQSQLISAVAVCVVAFAFSVRKAKTMVISVIMGFFAVFAVIPYFVNAVGFKRLTKLFRLEEEYMLGGTYDVSRIDNIRESLAWFKASPIFGGKIYNSTGGYSHFFPADVLMAGGMIGAIIAIMVMIGCAKGVVGLARNTGQQGIWLVLFATPFVIFSLTQGSYLSLISVFTAILLSAENAFKNNA